MREAYLVSWVSLVATSTAVLFGLVASQASGSPTMLSFALESGVDAISSAVCLWRWWGGGSLLLPEDELAGRERRAAAAIALAFVLLGLITAINAARHLAAGEEVRRAALPHVSPAAARIGPHVPTGAGRVCQCAQSVSALD